MLIHDQEGKTWRMESAIAAFQCEPVNPKEGEYIPLTSHWTATIPAIPYGEPPGTSESSGLQTPDGGGTYQRNNFN